MQPIQHEVVADLPQRVWQQPPVAESGAAARARHIGKGWVLLQLNSIRSQPGIRWIPCRSLGRLGDDLNLKTAHDLH